MPTVEIIHREHSLTDDQLAELLTPIISYTLNELRQLGATIDRCHIGGRGYRTVAHMGNVSTPLRQRGDGRYVPDHPEVIWQMQAAAQDEAEAERLFEPEIDLDVLPF